MKWRVVIYLLLELGIRRGELCALRWEDFDLENGIVSIRHSLSYTPSTGIFIDTTKTRNIRTLNISDRLIALLKQYRAEQAALILKFGDDFDNQGYLLTQERGKPINPEEITTYFCKFSKRYGVSVHAHAFRHNIASVMLASNVDAVTTAGVLGHASADTTTKVYAHVIERTKAMAQKGFTDAIYKRTKQA